VGFSRDSSVLSDLFAGPIWLYVRLGSSYSYKCKWRFLVSARKVAVLDDAGRLVMATKETTDSICSKKNVALWYYSGLRNVWIVERRTGSNTPSPC
jgi:hypothetical protein